MFGAKSFLYLGFDSKRVTFFDFWLFWPRLYEYSYTELEFILTVYE